MTDPLFDAYLAVDWSARSMPSPRRPSPDSIWVAEWAGSGSRAAPGGIRASYLRTRHACQQYLRDRLLDHVAHGRRVLVGFDFPFGYPRGFAAALGLGDPSAAPARSPSGPARAQSSPARERSSVPQPWRLIWDELDALVEDGPDNSNNRFEVAAQLNQRCGQPPGTAAPGPLWGCPRASAGPSLGVTSPLYPYRAGTLSLARLRWAEQLVRGTQPAWKLMGAGSAGSQCLLGIPVVSRLRSDPRLRDVSRVWPFETGFSQPPGPADGAFVLHAEVWPGIIRDHPVPSTMIKDAAQVRAVVSWLRSADGSGGLGKLLGPPLRLAPGAHHDILAEEGWILGG
jgi:hypothetical protein